MTKTTSATERKINEKNDGKAGALGNAGLDTSGEMRIGAHYTIGARGDGLVIRESHSGREKEISEASLEGLVKKEFFND